MVYTGDLKSPARNRASRFKSGRRHHSTTSTKRCRITNLMKLSERILGSLYKPECILTKAVEKTGKGEVKVTYVFPPYHRTLEDLGHIGMSQIQEGIIEGLYCAVGYAIDSGDIETTVSIEKYIRNLAHAIFRHENITFQKMLTAGEEAELIFHINDVQQKLRGDYYIVTLDIQGFLRGEVKCLMKKDVVGD